MDLPGRMDVPVTLVVPCHDEADRLDVAAWQRALDAWPTLTLVLVDDGSTDATRDLLDRLAAHPRVTTVHLPINRGKAEAVRQGVLAAPPGDVIGWWDADLAAPLEALPALVHELMGDERRELVLGSRVRLLGVAVRRRALRHYVGRVAATLASLLLDLPVYDTQCGAKVARDGAARELFAAPFHTTWTFDVELLCRLILRHPRLDRAALEAVVRELPLPRWNDVPGSHLRWTDVLRAPLDLWRIHLAYRVDRVGRLASSDSRPDGHGRTG